MRLCPRATSSASLAAVSSGADDICICIVEMILSCEFGEQAIILTYSVQHFGVLWHPLTLIWLFRPCFLTCRQEKFKKCKICSSKQRIKNIYVKGVKNDLVKSHIRVGDIITDAVSIPNLLNLKDL